MPNERLKRALKTDQNSRLLTLYFNILIYLEKLET